MKKITLDGTVDDVWRVMSIMLYPSDEQKQSSWIENTQHWSLVNRWEAIKERGLEDDLDSDYWVKANNFTSEGQSKRSADAKARKGTIVGDVAFYLYEMFLCEIPEPSLRKAFYIVGSRKRQYRHCGKKKNESLKEISHIFHEMKSAAHLWGALRINDHYQFVDNPFSSEENFTIFLSVAKTLQDFLTTFIPKRSKKPVLELGTIVELSADIPSGEYGFMPNKDFYQKILVNYNSYN